MQDNIVPISIVKELEDSYLSYAMSVIISRAIPDVRDLNLFIGVYYMQCRELDSMPVSHIKKRLV